MSVEAIIIGTLGDIVKKLVELEFTVRDSQNPGTLEKIAMYSSVLEEWPLLTEEDRGDVEALIAQLRIEILVYKKAKQELEELSSVKIKLADSCNLETLEKLLDCKNSAEAFLQKESKIRNILSALNKKGSHVGPVPRLLLKEPLNAGRSVAVESDGSGS